MHRYEGDITICKNCDHTHHLLDELILFCEKCSYDMRLKLTPEQEYDLIRNLDSTYKKMRVDNLR